MSCGRVSRTEIATATSRFTPSTIVGTVLGVIAIIVGSGFILISRR